METKRINSLGVKMKIDKDMRYISIIAGKNSIAAVIIHLLRNTFPDKKITQLDLWEIVAPEIKTYAAEGFICDYTYDGVNTLLSRREREELGRLGLPRAAERLDDDDTAATIIYRNTFTKLGYEGFLELCERLKGISTDLTWIAQFYIPNIPLESDYE